jgi:hypothetical protein
LAKKYTFNVVKEFHDLADYNHNIVHLKWKASSLDLNTSSVGFLCFDYAGFTLWATSLDAHGQKIHVF